MANLQYAGEYELEVCKICSTSGEIIDIISMVSSVNIFEDIFKSSLTGDISLVDTNNLLTALPIIGQEKLLLKLTTPQSSAVTRNNSLDFTDHPLYIYKVDSKVEINDNTAALVLSFTTAEAIRSNRIRVSQAFEGEPSADIIQKIIRDEDLLNSKKEFYYEETANNYKFVSPNMRPLDFINCISKRCLSDKYNSAPTFLFYETCKGFYFRTIDSMLDRKNVKTVYVDETPNLGLDASRNMLRLIKHNVVGSTNVMMNMRRGMYASNLLMVDLVNKTVENFNYNYFDSFENGEKQDIHVDAHANYPSEGAPLASESKDDFGNLLVDYDQSAQYMQAVDRNQPDGLLSVRHDGQFDYSGTDSWLQRRKGRFAAMDAAITLNVEVYGQTDISVGDLIGINIRNSDPRVKDQGDRDPYYGGRYLITKLRHVFKRMEGQPLHTMHMEVVRDTLTTPYPKNGVSFFDAKEVSPVDELIPMGSEDSTPSQY